MSIVLAGVSHKTAPVELRERGAERAEMIVECGGRQSEEGSRGLGPQTGAFREELQAIARAEFERQRRRLRLTPEQERAVEALLVSTANEIAHPAIEAMRRSSAAAEARQSRLEQESGLKLAATPALAAA